MSEFDERIARGELRERPGTEEFYETTSWAVKDLGPYLRGEKVVEPPAFFPRDDGQFLIYPNRPHTFFGESESLKTFAALAAAKSVLDTRHHVVFVDMEGDETSFVERCRDGKIADQFLTTGKLQYIRPTQPLHGDSIIDFRVELEKADPALVILDGVTELYALQGWDVNNPEDAAHFQNTFNFRGLCAFIAIDHTAKDAGRGVFGSQHKRAGLDGAEYEFKLVSSSGRGGESISKVRVTKDRHGRVRAWAGEKGYIGTLHVNEDGISLRAGEDHKDVRPSPRDKLRNQVLDQVDRHPDGILKRDLRALVGRRNEDVTEMLGELERQEYIKQEVVAGRGGAITVSKGSRSRIPTPE